MLAWLAAAVLLGGPAAAQPCLTTLAPSRDFSTVHTQTERWPTSDELDEMAQALDSDGDGHITSEEVAAFEASTRGPAESWPPLRLDGLAPSSVQQWTNVTGAEGPASQRSGWIVMTERLFRFEPDEAVRHAVEGEDPEGGEPSAVEFRAPTAWWVEKVNGTRHHRPEFRMAEFDACAPLRIDFVAISAVPNDQSHETGSTGTAGSDAENAPGMGTGAVEDRGNGSGAQAAALPVLWVLAAVAIALGRHR